MVTDDQLIRNLFTFKRVYFKIITHVFTIRKH